MPGGRCALAWDPPRVHRADSALEAKCYDLNTGVGVEAQSRLISRFRPRQFGVLVTTSSSPSRRTEDSGMLWTNDSRNDVSGRFA